MKNSPQEAAHPDTWGSDCAVGSRWKRDGCFLFLLQYHDPLFVYISAENNIKSYLLVAFMYTYCSLRTQDFESELGQLLHLLGVYHIIEQPAGSKLFKYPCMNVSWAQRVYSGFVLESLSNRNC